MAYAEQFSTPWVNVRCSACGVQQAVVAENTMVAPLRCRWCGRQILNVSSMRVPDSPFWADFAR